jgi:hypothetical protein
MFTAKRMSVAAAASAVTVALIFGALTIYPIPIVGGVFVAAGFPLGALILHVTPDSFIRELAPSGGPDAVGWAFGLGALVTWFVVFLGLWFVILRHMRSNSTPHTDARASTVSNQASSARAGERGR